MSWPNVQDAIDSVVQPAGYRCELLRRSEIAPLIAALATWFPGIAVGTASCYLRETFYSDKVLFEDATDRDIIVLVAKTGNDLVGMVSYERDRDCAVLYGRVVAVSQQHRRSGLGETLALLQEAVARAIGMGMTYVLATLSSPYIQLMAEKHGWHLFGIVPGFDRELLTSGEVKRVYEAVYCKVLVPDEELLRPRAENLTAKTRALFDLLFPGKVVE